MPIYLRVNHAIRLNATAHVYKWNFCISAAGPRNKEQLFGRIRPEVNVVRSPSACGKGVRSPPCVCVPQSSIILTLWAALQISIICISRHTMVALCYNDQATLDHHDDLGCVTHSSAWKNKFRSHLAPPPLSSPPSKPEEEYDFVDLLFRVSKLDCDLQWPADVELHWTDMMHTLRGSLQKGPVSAVPLVFAGTGGGECI